MGKAIKEAVKKNDRTLGSFQELVLKIISSKPGISMTGILKIISETNASMDTRENKVISPGPTYLTLKRLEDKGFITFVVNPSTGKRGGRATSVYTITESGLAELNAVESMRDNVKTLLEKTV